MSTNNQTDQKKGDDQKRAIQLNQVPALPGDEGKMSDSLKWFAFVSYGVGHVLNDLVASMWFTYALVFYHYVMQLSSINAGAVVLVGQLTDAVATAAIGMLSDNANMYCTDRYGRRKTWHLFGSILVFISLPFAFSPPILPQVESSELNTALYYCFFIVFFQIGWASIENSHMALASDLTPIRDERTALLSIRYSFTVFSNILVYVVTWIVLRSNNASKSQFGPSEKKEFQIVILVIMIVGAMTTIIFHIGVREPLTNNRVNRELLMTETEAERAANSFWSMFKHITLYQTAIVYMCSRITVNMTLVFLPMYLQDYLKLEAEKLALLPLIMFLSSFCMSLLNKPMNMKLGRKYTYSFGVILSLASALWCYLGNSDTFAKYQIYAVTIIIGIACSVVLVTSQALTTDLIGDKTHRGAFTFGLMSFTDKVCNGAVVMAVQSLHCETCPDYYRDIMIYNWTIPSFLAFIAVISLPYGGRPSLTVPEIPETRSNSGNQHLDQSKKQPIEKGQEALPNYSVNS
ncbi:major facilitator superfamily domain-containing protein 12-like isoform X1 [Melanaphis sacchari]|uniref:Major facilitator superfamily domain-containing protein 12 n=2 Tax=Melanaphis sacchari TaxID=742174 RepID=A0A2H8TYQ3_9HEMI|nr:major facilitator superfamily domain-containing protein 12-like isoform X1 [Melanaphis sacchari]